MSEAHEAGRAEYWKARALAAEGRLGKVAALAMSRTAPYASGRDALHESLELQLNRIANVVRGHSG